jgi:hypothetical protein
MMPSRCPSCSDEDENENEHENESERAAGPTLATVPPRQPPPRQPPDRPSPLLGAAAFAPLLVLTFNFDDDV